MKAHISTVVVGPCIDAGDHPSTFKELGPAVVLKFENVKHADKKVLGRLLERCSEDYGSMGTATYVTRLSDDEKQMLVIVRGIGLEPSPTIRALVHRLVDAQTARFNAHIRTVMEG